MTVISNTPTDVAIMTALRSLVLAIMPAGVEVVRAQDNRVPEPDSASFITLTMNSRSRIATNVDNDQDCAFTGSVSGTTLTVTAMLPVAGNGTIQPTYVLLGTNVPASTSIVQQLTGTPGGVGTYQLNNSFTLASTTLACGNLSMAQEQIYVVQADIHSDDGADMSNILTTVIRSDYGVSLLQSFNAAVWPLYCSDPQQIPFLDGEQQIEERWTIDISLQVNMTLLVAQAYAGSLALTIIDVDTTYPH